MHTKLIRTSLKYLATIVVVGGYLRARVRVGAHVLLVSVALVFSLSPLTALAVTQGYNTSDKTISRSMAVAVASTQGQDSNQTITVEKSSLNHADKTLGVVVDPEQDTVAVSANGSQVYVATTGSADVFVTDLNGPIHKGDLLATSPVGGVLMKAIEGNKGILGAAQDDFPTSNVQTISVRDNSGQTTKAKVALVKINMDVKFSTSNKPSGQSTLERIGQSVVHHQVSSVRVVVAMAILLMLTVVVSGVIYSSISSSLIALGRNPYAKKTIMRGLRQVSALMLTVLIVGLVAVYLVLWL